MNIKTTTKHTLTVNASDLKKNFYTSSVQLLQDVLDHSGNDFENFRNTVSRFQDEIEGIEKNGFTSSFQEGYTMTLLDPSDFKYVENWFNDDKNFSEELVVRILDDAGKEVEVVNHIDLCY